MLKTVGGAAALAVAGPLVSRAFAAGLKGHINHSVCLWCYNAYMKQANMSLDDYAAACTHETGPEVDRNHARPTNGRLSRSMA